MKQFIILSAIIFGALTACEKAAEPDLTTNPFVAAPNADAQAVGCTGPNWGYYGVEPFKVKVDGVTKTYSQSQVSMVTLGGFHTISAMMNGQSVNLAIKVGSAPGAYTTPSPNNITLNESGSGYVGAAIKNGEICLMQNTDSLLEGKFYSNLMDMSDSTMNRFVTEGYFKVSKF